MKNFILTSSIVGSLAAYALFNSQEVGICGVVCGDWVGQYQNIFLFFPLLFLVVLLIYKMPHHVFLSWWKFARITIPLILFLSWLMSLGLHHNPGGFFNMDHNFDLLGLIVMYVFFVLGSLIQIWKGYRSK